MSDATVRARANDIPVYQFDSLAWTNPKPLSEARIAVVTTAGLTTESGGLWSQSDEGFTVLPHGTTDLSYAHFSPNFDRSGFNLDVNTVLPIDRLDELAAAGIIGSVAERHISFMGAQADHNLATMRLDTGPAAAQLLRQDGVDTILLTPV